MSDETPAALRIALLGAPLVEVDGAPLAVDTRKATALLAYLAITDRPVRRDGLAALCWPEADPERARSALRRTLSTLRSALGGRWLVTDRETVTLALDDAWFDVHAFRDLVASCATHGHGPNETCSRCAAPLEAAAALDRGPFLHGFGLRDSVEFDDWQQLTTEELRREVAAVLDRLGGLLGSRGAHATAIATARRRLALDPLHEPAHRNLIALLADAGDRAAALEQYRECVRTLDRELGVRPLDETTALYHAVLEGTRAPAAAPAVSPAPADHEGPYALVGRDPEVGALRAAIDAVARGGLVLAIVGEAGIGKSRLLGELAAEAVAEGLSVVEARCFEDEGELAFGVVAGLVRSALAVAPAPAPDGAWWIAEAARLLPELGPPPTEALDSVGAQARFYEAISALLTESCAGAETTGALLVDDLHWADEASLGLLLYLVHRLADRRLLVALTWRPEELAADHPLRRLEADTSAAGAHHLVRPARLSTADVEALLSREGRDPALAPRLHRATGGLPFFLVEYLDALARGEEHGDGVPVPGGIRDLLGARLASLGELGGQVIAAAAVLGRSFDAETVRDTSGRADDETVAALEELVVRGLLTEASDGTFDFRHEQTRAIAYDAMSLARRRLLHRRAAAALGLRGRRDELAAPIAQHLALAGDELAAAEWYRLAGDRARRLYANVEAVSHYRSALALGDPAVAELQMALGDLATLAGDYGAALAAYETAAANADAALLPRVEHCIALLHLRRGAWDLADAELVSAIGRVPALESGRMLADRSLVAHRRDDPIEAERLAQEALALAEQGGDLPALAQAHNILGMLAGRRGAHAEAVAEMERGLDLARAARDREAEAAALNNLALAVSREGELDEAIVLAAAALAVCVELGDRHREAALRNTLADLLHRSGREEESMAELKAAVTIFAEIGEDGKLEPEIWKLSEW